MTVQAFLDQYQIQLNEQQQRAVGQVEGPVLLLAVPGSGKTTVLVARLGYLLHCHGVLPGQILTMTYTVAAAGDMRRRYEALFGAQQAQGLSFRTINGICASIINHYARVKDRTPFELVPDEARLSAVLRELFKRVGAAYPTDQEIKEVRTRITYCKNMLLASPEIDKMTVDGVDFPAIFWEYHDYMTRSRLMDFDDQMVIAHHILRKCPDILNTFQSRCQFLNVDEAQDTSRIQHLIIQLLAGSSGNLFMVGDEDQSIYGFRAAYPKALMAFERTYPGARVLLMETNYRSTQSIVERANSFIAQNENRRPKHMQAGRGILGAPIKHTILEDYSQQHRYLAQAAQNCTIQTAVLYRNSDSAIPIIDFLTQHKIPYTCRQRDSYFFSHPIVRDVTDIIRFSQQPDNHTLFQRLYYKLGLWLRKDAVEQLLRQRQGGPILDQLLTGGTLEPWQAGRMKALQLHLTKLPELDSFVALERIIHSMGYGDYLTSKKADMGKLSILLSLARQNPQLVGFLDRLETLRELVSNGAEAECPFLLSTIHASKGLEFERVILIDTVDGTFPSIVDTGQSMAEEDRQTLEEERRLFYVAVTRAKAQLELISYQRQFGEPAPCPSFLYQFLGVQPETVQSAQDKPTGEADGYQPGEMVVHKSFGTGVLLDRVGGIATIRFVNGAVKKVDLTACLKKQLIHLLAISNGR